MAKEAPHYTTAEPIAADMASGSELHSQSLNVNDIRSETYGQLRNALCFIGRWLADRTFIMPIMVLPEDRPPGALLAALRADSMCTFVCSNDALHESLLLNCAWHTCRVLSIDRAAGIPWPVYIRVPLHRTLSTPRVRTRRTGVLGQQQGTLGFSVHLFFSHCEHCMFWLRPLL